MENSLAKIISGSGLDKQKSDYLLEKFADCTAVAESWAAKAKEIVVTDESQTSLMKDAREGRLLLKDKRVEIEKTRKELKAASLAEGRAIDDIAKALTALIEPTEKYLDEQEKFAERKEAERIKALQSERYELLKPYLNEYDLVAPMEYGKMHEKQFDALFAGYKATYEKKIADEKLAEEQRIAQQKADEEAREAQRIENERLKAEAAEREKQFAEERKAAQEKADKERKEAEEKARKEREEIEAKAKEEREKAAAEAKKQKDIQDKKLKEEREAREKLEAELKAKREQEQKELEEAEKLASAGDKEKIADLLQRLMNFELPQVKSKKAKAIIASTSNKIIELIDNITQSAQKL